MSHKHHSTHERRTEERWRVDLELEEPDGEIVAKADLYTGGATYEAHGCTHATGLDSSVARQTAAARALSGLAHQLVNDASRTVSRAAHAVSTATHDVEDAADVLNANSLEAPAREGSLM
jgi:hypothetical protein